jgi:ubiquinone/menaquinone biosynthesis C-methylase UbiE
VSVRERVFAALYDPFSKTAEQKFGAEAKRKLLANARGRVLEIGVGTGLSFPHYPADVQLVGIDASQPMLRRAERRAEELGRKVTLVQAPAEALPFEDGAFDTAVSLVVLCSVDDPTRALEELHRVLRPGGHLLFIEHVRSDDPSLARRQDRYAGLWGWFACGCHPNRDTLRAIEAAGFEVVELEREERPEIPKLVRPHVKGWAEAS